MPKSWIKTMRIFVILGLALLSLAGCSRNVILYKEAQKQYNRGNLDSALNYNIQSLRLKPGYSKAQILILQVYPDLIAQREANVARLMNSQDVTRWARMIEEYSALEAIQEQIRTLPRLVNPETGLTVTFDFHDYSGALTEAKNNAAEYHYQNGLNLSRQGTDLEIQKRAAIEFRNALNIVPNYRDAEQRFAQARANAIKRIAVVPFEDLSGTNRRYGDISSQLVDQIISAVMSDPEATEFVEIITRDQLNPVLSEQRLAASGLVDENTASQIGVLVGAHEILTGKITQIAYVPARVTRQNETDSRRIVTGREEYVDDQGNTQTKDIYAEVECNWTRYTKTVSAQITGTYNIIEVSSGRIKRQGTYTAEYPWNDSWGRKESGDERALSTASATLCRKTEPLPPAEIELVNQAVSRLSTYFITEFKRYIQQ